ncbi:MAG: NAD-dependent deacylase [Pseudomonadota bacterium]
MDHIVILTGAGISAESGMGTFRDKDGLWTKVSLEDVATPEGFARDPERVHEFYNERRAGCLRATPNAAHMALARLQREHRGHITLVTQNVDSLHEAGGSTDVIHMHGALLSALCSGCGYQWPWTGNMSLGDVCADCGTTGTVRPDVVWFGEVPYHMDEIVAALEQATVFAAIGTSGNVYPAAGFVSEARRLAIPTVEINLERTEATALFDHQIMGPATEAVPRFVDAVLSGSLTQTA